MRNLLLGAGALGAFVAAACVTGAAATPAPAAKPESKPARACFRTDQVRNFTAPDQDKLYVRVGARDVYELQMMGFCPDLDWSHALGLRARGSSWVCAGFDVDVVVPQPGGGRPQTCPVRAVKKLTEDEVKALKDKP